MACGTVFHSLAPSDGFGGMTQLTYNEAFDPFHAAFRLLRLHVGCGISERTPFDMCRILDFYLLFPFRLQNMKLLSEDTGWRKISRSYSGQAPYGELPDDNSIFSRMEPFQRAAASSLAHAGIISVEAWANNEIAFADVGLPAELRTRCGTLNDSMPDVIEILCDIRRRYPLGGRDGLKDRTGLLEFRYDPI